MVNFQGFIICFWYLVFCIAFVLMLQNLEKECIKYGKLKHIRILSLNPSSRTAVKENEKIQVVGEKRLTFVFSSVHFSILLYVRRQPTIAYTQS